MYAECNKMISVRMLFTEMACPEGFEPPTYCLEGSCSIRLSYGHIIEIAHQVGVQFIGAGDGNRTHAASLEGWNSTIEQHPHRLAA